MTFRNLKPTEIQIRPTDTKFKGSCTLLLYQTARAAMDILDETVGPENWQKEYYEVKGNVYCRIGINTENGFVWKADCGIESNVDAAKGEASDAFKRAAVNWGIGRELYSGPRIKVRCPDEYYKDEKLIMSFFVRDISYEGKSISSITIVDRNNKVVFTWGTGTEQVEQTQEQSQERPTNTILDGLKTFCQNLKGKVDKAQLVNFYTFYEPKTHTWRGKMDYQTLWSRWMERAV